MTLPDWALGKPQEGSVAVGFGGSCALNFIIAIAEFSLGILFYERVPVAGFLFTCLIYFGISQLAYMVPLYLYFRKTGRKDTAKGVALAAGVIALVSAACWATIAPR